MAADTGPEEPARGGARSFDLRERKRTRTRLMIQTEALRLFAAKGYAQTTVEEIADAAAISPRTFFRYFPTKEDVVIWDEYDPLALELLQSRPRDEPLVETLRGVVRETLGGLHRRDPERLLTRVRLSATVPEVRARFLEETANGVDELARVWAAGADEFRVRILGSSLLAAVSVALDLWQADGGGSDPLTFLDRATEALAEGMSDLRSSTRRAGRARSD
jgi:AcrR family transcriptional regulator